jgi:hypothetical protein
VNSVLVVGCLVGCENVAKMALANDDDVIKTFPSDRADQPLRISEGDRAETGRSRMPMARMRRMKAAPYAPSRSRIK